MNDWQDRVRAERTELADRLTKLSAFIDENVAFGTLDEEGRALLKWQRKSMTDYLSALDQRIARF